MKLRLLAIATFAVALSASAQIPLDYYAGLNGLSGSELKTAVHDIVSSDDVLMLSYGSSTSGGTCTWWGFYVTDLTDDGYVRDRYSDQNFSFGTRGASVSGMNIEHSFPKSWWGGEQNNAYKDLFNLMPCESSINSSKSNYPMANVDKASTDNGVTKVGTKSGDSGKYWEPADKWKGDFSRGYLYMATAYQDFTWTGDQSVRILNTEAYPTLQSWASSLYLSWMKDDPVDEIETTRNNVVEKLQGNRNPFVDFPNLGQYIWGDSINVPFNPLTSKKSQAFVGGATITEKSSETNSIYSNTFLGDTGSCTQTTASSSASGITVWSNNSEYGWKASGSRGSSSNLTTYATDATLLTPEIDLTSYRAAWFSFDHAVKFATAPYSSLSVEVIVNGSAEPLHVRRWPIGTAWTFYNSGIVDLTPWAGKKIKIGFHYTSTTSEAPTWEIKNLSVVGVDNPSATEIISISNDYSDYQAVTENYTIDGRRHASADNLRGIVIIRRGSQVTKTYIP
jgi:hypothetical protein